MEKTEWLKELYPTRGNFELQQLITRGKEHIPKFKKWIPYNSASSEIISQSNARTLTRIEGCLDIDSADQLNPIIEKLKSSELKYETWSTGSRGFHIILLFKELQNFSDEFVGVLRKILCKKYGTDPCMGGARVMVALEHTAHFKTGRIKNYMPELSDPGNNVLTPELRREIDLIISKETKMPTHPAAACVDLKGRPHFQTIQKLKSNHYIWNVATQSTVVDRSAMDFLLAKFCVENGITFSEYVKVLLSTTWSKIHIQKHGIKYAQLTFMKASQIELDFRRKNKMEVKHVKSLGRTTIGDEIFKLDIKEFTAKDGNKGEFLSLLRGRESKEGEETFFQVRKNYTVPLKAAAWLGKVLQENFQE